MATLNKLLYQKLAEYIKTKLPKSYHSKFYAWFNGVGIIDQGKNITDDGIELYHLKYEGILWLDEIAFEQLNLLELIFHINAWLEHNDPLREILDMGEVDFTTQIVDDKSANVSFTIDFQEPITAVKANDGNIVVNGERYLLAPVPIYVAEHLQDIGVVRDV